MAAAFGLYFGNTNLCLAIHKDDKTEVVANDSGDRVTPAVVAFSNGEKSVGLAAKSEILRNPTGTICQIKSVLGASEDDVKRLAEQSACKMVCEGRRVRFEVSSGENGRQVHYSEDLLRYLFQKMFEVASSRSDSNEAFPVVVAVPPSFTEEQHKMVRLIATKVGFKVHRLINEPTAAVLAYHVGSKPSTTPCRYLVYRMGGSTTDATLVTVLGGAYTLDAHVRRSDLGGKLITKELAEHCATEFQRQMRADMRESRRGMAKLLSAAETAKHVLSTLETAQCFAESVYEGLDLSVNVSRARFESLLGPIISRCKEPLQEILTNASLTPKDIHKVVLCGGSCKVQKLRRALAAYFPEADILDSKSPDEVVALGAAAQAALLCDRDNQQDIPVSRSAPCLSKGIYIKPSTNGSLTLVIPPGTAVPTRWQCTVRPSEKQSSVCLQVYEKGDHSGGDDSATLLAKVVMKEIEENAPLVATISVRSDGSVHISCSDKQKGHTESVTLEPLTEESPVS
ncbi:heat shock 70 kDa protein 14-like [Ornithodoros turicata]|uniref:heat shock 70 kDa protein 14-like n=1 Tax=Ornithodoros turicata TaxID=34597 RepID=UPI0031399EAF